MKQFSLLLSILLPLLGCTAFAQSGMTVFGDCSLQENATIGFFGENLTLQSDILGEGKIVMKGEESQKIVANAHRISNLVVDNSSVVKIEGSLTVDKSLLILRGNVEILPAAQLLLSRKTAVNVAVGSHIIHSNVARQNSTDALPTTQNYNPMLGYCGFLASTKAELMSRQSTDFTAVKLLLLLYKSPYLQTVVPPPQV